MSIRWRKDRKKYEASRGSGSDRERALFKTKHEAKAFVEGQKNFPLRTQELQREGVTLAYAIKFYYDTVSSRKCKETHVNEKRILNLTYHFFKINGLNLVSDVSPIDVRGLQRWLSLEQAIGDGKKRALAPATVNRWFATIKNLFNACVEWEWILVSPCRFLKALPEDEFLRRVWSDFEFEEVLKRAPEYFKSVLKFTYLTGLRPSSTARLEWDHVDFHTKTITVLSRKGSTGSMRARSFPMTESLSEELQSLRGRSGHVFKMPDKTPMRADFISKKTSEIIKDCGLKGISLYGLRHKLAVDLEESGAGTESIRRLLGHSSIRMTQEYLKQISSKGLAEKLNQVGR